MGAFSILKLKKKSILPYTGIGGAQKIVLRPWLEIDS